MKARASIVTACVTLAVGVGMAAPPLVGGSDARAGQPERERLERPEVVALKFHADWCPSCKALGPVLADLTERLEGEPALLVELDLTNERTTAQARYLMAMLGMGSIWQRHAGKTGFILVVDAERGKVVDTLTRDDSRDEMVAAISRHLRG